MMESFAKMLLDTNANIDLLSLSVPQVLCTAELLTAVASYNPTYVGRTFLSRLRDIIIRPTCKAEHLDANYLDFEQSEALVLLQVMKAPSLRTIDLRRGNHDMCTPVFLKELENILEKGCARVYVHPWDLQQTWANSSTSPSGTLVAKEPTEAVLYESKAAPVGTPTPLSPEALLKDEYSKTTQRLKDEYTEKQKHAPTWLHPNKGNRSPVRSPTRNAPPPMTSPTSLKEELRRHLDLLSKANVPVLDLFFKNAARVEQLVASERGQHLAASVAFLRDHPPSSVRERAVTILQKAQAYTKVCDRVASALLLEKLRSQEAQEAPSLPVGQRQSDDVEAAMKVMRAVIADVLRGYGLTEDSAAGHINELRQRAKRGDLPKEESELLNEVVGCCVYYRRAEIPSSNPKHVRTNTTRGVRSPSYSPERRMEKRDRREPKREKRRSRSRSPRRYPRRSPSRSPPLDSPKRRKR